MDSATLVPNGRTKTCLGRDVADRQYRSSAVQRHCSHPEETITYFLMVSPERQLWIKVESNAWLAFGLRKRYIKRARESSARQTTACDLTLSYSRKDHTQDLGQLDRA